MSTEAHPPVASEPPATGEPRIDEALAAVVHDQSPEALARALEVLQTVLDDQAGDSHQHG